MTSLLVNHILQTEKWTSPELFETKNRIYTFLNPVSYLIALENKSLFEQFQGIGFTCGGFVHQTAMNRMHYYPNWVDKMNLRFVYRMYKEKHTRTRYLQAAFLFPVRFIGERIFG